MMKTTTLYEDILSINESINTNEKESKWPRFISSRIANKQRKKLLKIIDVLRNSNVALSYNYIEDFILDILLYNKGSYGNIFWTKNIIDEEKNIDIIESCFINDTYKAIFKFDHNSSDNKFSLQLTVKTIDGTKEIYDNYNMLYVIIYYISCYKSINTVLSYEEDYI